MAPATILTLAILLAAVFASVLAVMLWQEAKKRQPHEPPTYGIEEASEFVLERLDPETRSRLGKAGVRRVLEWEVFYLQGLAQPNRHNPVVTVAGGHEASVEYIVEQISTRHGVTYSSEDVMEVLEREAEYLVSIGAVGDPVEGEL
ncbi:MAG TPA: hypothetical protein VID03_04605 [Acidimicrobiia bacterium]